MDKARGENVSPSSSSSCLSSNDSPIGVMMSSSSDSNPSGRSDRKNTKPRRPKKFGVFNKKKGRFGFGAAPRVPHKPMGRKPRPGVGKAMVNSARKSENPVLKKQLMTQGLEIKQLNNRVVELQNENASIKMETQTLRQVQARLQHKTKEEKTADELTARYIQDTQALQDELRKYKKQLRAAEVTMKHKDESYGKQQRQMEKNKETIAHIKELLTRKGQESRDELLREIDKLKKLVEDAQERAATVEQNADMVQTQHQQSLYMERKKTAEATKSVICLLEMVQELNRRLMVEEMVIQTRAVMLNKKADAEAETK